MELMTIGRRVVQPLPLVHYRTQVIYQDWLNTWVIYIAHTRPPSILNNYNIFILISAQMLHRSDNEFIEFIKYDGCPKSIVDNEKTTFSFRASEKKFDETLARYANLLKSPLDRREYYRIAQNWEEFVHKLNSNAWEHGEEKLLSLLGNPGHPSCNFKWGIMKALNEKMDDDAFYQRIEEFRSRHYSAHRISLCLQTHLSLDEMQVRIQRKIKYYFIIYSTKLISAIGIGCKAFFVGAE